MPELPEVETIKRVLSPQLVGQKIVDIRILDAKAIAYPEVTAFCRGIAGQSIRALNRRGKFLIMGLQKDSRLILHLRMTGQLIVAPPDFPSHAHTRLVLTLQNGCELRFLDQRRFGRVWFLNQNEPDLYSGVDKLGLEPFDTSLNANYLKNELLKSRRPIKTCLLDQRIVAGIGNIYADEILFSIGLNPARLACSLQAKEWNLLAKSIPTVLLEKIAQNDISAEDYLAGFGKEYRNTPFLKVYGHENDPCPLCGQPIARKVIGGRSSYFCPSCQKE